MYYYKNNIVSHADIDEKAMLRVYVLTTQKSNCLGEIDLSTVSYQ